MSERKSKKQSEEEAAAALDSTMVLNPVVGLSTEELLRTARDLIGRAMLQPSVVLSETTSLWSEWLSIGLGRSERSADVIAVEDVVVYTLTSSDFESLLGHPYVARTALKSLAERVRE